MKNSTLLRTSFVLSTLLASHALGLSQSTAEAAIAPAPSVYAPGGMAALKKGLPVGTYQGIETLGATSSVKCRVSVSWAGQGQYLVRGFYWHGKADGWKMEYADAIAPSNKLLFSSIKTNPSRQKTTAWVKWQGTGQSEIFMTMPRQTNLKGASFSGKNLANGQDFTCNQMVKIK